MNNTKKDKETEEAIRFFYDQARVVNPGNNPEKAAALAIKAAVERNPTYKSGITKKEKSDIHKTWTKLLIDKLDKYKKCQGKDAFVEDVKDIYYKMNSDKFKKLFSNNGRGKDDKYPKEFRIAHSQKSLSIFLKHMWFNIEDMPEPPVCPIDGVILKAVGSNGSWTKLNDLKTYTYYLDKVEKKANAKGMSPAKWELITWNNPKTKDSTLMTEHQNTFSFFNGQQKNVSKKQERHTNLNKSRINNILPTQEKTSFPLQEESTVTLESFKPFGDLTNRIYHDEFVVGYIIPLKETDSDEEKKFMLFVAHNKKGYFCQIRYCYDEVNILDYRPFRIITQNKDGVIWKRRSDALPTFKSVSFEDSNEGKKKALSLMRDILKDINAPDNVIKNIPIE